MNEIKIVEPEIHDLQVSSGDMLNQAQLLEVVDDATCNAGGDILLEITRRMRSVDARFEEPVSSAFKTHRSLTALRDSCLAPFKLAQKAVDDKIKAYRVQIRRKREAEQLEAIRVANAKAEADRIAKAEAQMDRNDLKGCEQTLKAPLPPPIVQAPVTMAPPEKKGISYRTQWCFQVTDPNAVPREYCSPDDKKIRGVVNAMQGATNIPGIMIWAEEVSNKRVG